ncbi:MAG: peptidoglycan synthetase FtsI [Pseudomonadota bacterium]|jgi:cell division protein FtsI (penicillin-binding protein 3)
MNDSDLSLTGFDMAGYDRGRLQAHPGGPQEPRVRLRSKGAAALEQGRSRLLVTAALFAIAFIAVCAKLVDATILTGGAEPRATRAASATAPQSRADIVDRNGTLLATSLTTASLYVDPKLVIDPKEAATKLLKVLPDLDRAELMTALTEDKRFVWIRRNLTPRQQYEVNRLGIPGLAFQKEERRIYPQGNLAAHVVGFSGIDNVGLMGIEQAFDQQLKQTNQPLQLSIDVRLQHILRREILVTMEEFRAIGGAGMVMDIHTGEMLAMVSLPDFDPHSPPSPIAEQDLDPRFNRNTLGVYEPGSTFKVFNTAMALESGKVRLHDSFDATRPIRIGRHSIADFKGKNRWLDVVEVFKYSSNIGSVRMAEVLGPAAQRDFLTRLGLTRPLTLELPELGRPIMPANWREVNMMTISFGHGMSVSPVHVLTATAAVVNGGIERPATLLKRERGETAPGTRVLSEDVSEVMRRMLRMVVTDGTAGKADALGYIVGGKTGTAEKVKGGVYSKKARISSFVGAFPMHDPRYVVYVMLDEPKPSANSFGYATAGWTAAPTVGRVVAQIGPLLGVRPVDPESPEIVHALAMEPRQTAPQQAAPQQTAPQAPGMTPQMASFPSGNR